MKKICIEKLFISTTHDERTLRILLPDDYETSQKDYPVIYMHDGQNLFEDETSYGGHSWGIYECIRDLIKHSEIEDMIIVGIDNSSLRMSEYSPWKNNFIVNDRDILNTGGKGDVYAEFIVESVIPFIEKHYRVRNDFRYIAGSSMGAYISMYMISRYPHLFKGAGIFSLASWFNEEPFLDYVEQSKLLNTHKFFISIGSNETSSKAIEDFNLIYLNNSRRLRDLLYKKGVTDIEYIETDDVHNEPAWRKVFPKFYRFINNKGTITK